jgi:diacylglycerol O-acyltransferase / wax synthase
MERLSSLDAVFLAVEDRVNQMNIGTVAIFDGPAPRMDDARDFLARRIALIRRCRQRVREPAGALGRPVWIDDVRFDPSDHIHALSLRGHDMGDLDRLAEDLLSLPLDRSRPLWEVWVVEGLARGQWAVIAKVHHCMVDGIAGNDLLCAILDQRSDGDAALPKWVPSPEPSALAFAWFNVRTALGSLIAHVRNAADVLGHPVRSWDRARNVLVAARQLWYRQPHRPTSLTGPIGTHRRWTHIAVSFDQVRAIRVAFGATVNDVVVTAVASGFRDLLVERGESVEGRTITAMIPVSLRGAAEHGQAGNRVANVHARLPVGSTDPRSTLQTVHEHVEDLKNSHEIEATDLLLRVGDYVPRVLADRVARSVLHRQRNVETVITNVPGPRSPLYLGSNRMIEGYPIAPIGGRVRISVAIWSYCGHLFLGITGDRDTAPDIERLGQGITRGFADLLDAAQSD